MDEMDKERLIRIDENVSQLKIFIPKLHARVNYLESSQVEQKIHNRWIKFILGSIGSVILSAIAGIVIFFKK